jgi:hypothetical protein
MRAEEEARTGQKQAIQITLPDGKVATSESGFGVELAGGVESDFLLFLRHR